MSRNPSFAPAGRSLSTCGRSVLSGLLCLGTFSLLVLSGCGVGTTSSPAPDSPGVMLQGKVHGGQQPVNGSKVYLYAASTAGYPSDSATVPSSLLGGSGYVTTDNGGNFSISGDYTCPTVTGGSQVYILAVGGNPGNPGTGTAAQNPNLVLMAALGTCPSAGTLPSNLFIDINEVSTVASAYALAQFMGYPNSDTTSPDPGTAPYVGSSSTNTTGLANAFATVGNLMSLSTGLVNSVTPAYASNVNAANMSYVPAARINTLANALAACVNSTGGSYGDGAGPGGTTDSPCGILFDNTTPNATSVPPTDTLQAILNLAQAPGASSAVSSALYTLSTSGPVPFSPALTSVPNDWTLALGFTGGGFGRITGGTVTDTTFASGMAIDAKGNVWVTSGDPHGTADGSSGTGFVAEFDNQGNPLSSATTASTLGGYHAGGLMLPRSIAIDLTGNVWIGNDNSTVSVLNSGGTQALAPVSGSGLLKDVGAIAIDSSGNVWTGSGSNNLLGHSAAVSGAVAEFNSSTGALQSPSGGYTGGAFYGAIGSLAFDPSGNLWLSDFSYGDLYYIAPSSPTTRHELAAPGTAESSTGSILAVNGLGNVFTFAAANGALAKVPGTTGTSTAYNSTTRQGNSLSLDGAGMVWSVGPANGKAAGPGYLDEYSSVGARLSPATGFTGSGGGGESALLAASGTGGGTGCSTGGSTAPGTNCGNQQVMVDGSGNVWVLNPYTSVLGSGAATYQLVKFIGLAAPAITPIAAALPSKLGTRP